MNQHEAAQFLGVTDRTLRHYTRQGRIPATWDKTRKRRTLVYAEEALRALKAELEQARRWQTPPAESARTDTIGFRVDAHYRAQLTEAAQKHGLSAGAYARVLVISALDADPTQALSRLRHDLATSVYALLAYAGTLTPEQAERWVRENLLQG